MHQRFTSPRTCGISLSLSLAAFAVAIAGCGKSTQFQGESAADLGLNTLKPASNVTNSSDATADARLETLRREVSNNDRYLESLIDTEREERVEADVALNTRLNLLDERIDTLAAEMRAEIARLDMMDSAIVNDQQGALAAYNQWLAQMPLAQQTALREAIGDPAALLNAAPSAMTASIAGLDPDIRAKVKQLVERYQSLKAHMSTNYASRNELERLSFATREIKEITNILGKNIDRNDKEIRALIDIEIEITISNFSAKLATVEATVADLNGKFSAQIVLYSDALESIQGAMREEMDAVRSDLLTTMGQALQDHKTEHTKIRTDMLIAIKKSAAEFEVKAQAMKEELATRLLELSDSIDGTDQAILEAKLEVQKQMNKALAKEQAIRAQMEKDLTLLAKEIERVAGDVANVRALAEATAADAKTLRLDFETNKSAVARELQLQGDQITKLDTALNHLRQETKKDLEEVGDLAATMVKNLGSKVQKQMRKVTIDMANLERQQKATDQAVLQLTESIADAHANRQAFRDSFLPARASAQQAAIDLMLAMQELEETFVAAIDPRQNALPFYDSKFRPIMQKCGGNTEATFANAYGMDSFQFLAREYVRQLTFGVRTGKTDAIFVNKGRLVTETTLTKLVLHAMIEVTIATDQVSCVEDIQGWALSTLHGDNPKSAELRSTIAGNSNLARAVLKFVDKLYILDTSAAKIVAIFNNSVEGRDDAQALREGSLPQVALNLMEAARAEYEIRERKAMYNRIVGVQNTLGEANPSLKSEVESIRAILEAKMEKFKNEISERVTSVESRMGNLEESVKRALDILLTLSIRTGEDDLVDGVIDAGKPIAYTPKEWFNFEPRIIEIQHFFDSPALRNGTDACSGRAIILGAGVHFRSQCWVNFRSIPRDKWAGTVKNIWFRVFGSAHAFDIDADNVTGHYDFRNAKSHAGMTLHGSYAEGVFDLKANDLLTSYVSQKNPSWNGTNIRFTPYRISGNDTTAGDAVNYRIQLFSPVVLDFRSVGEPALTDASTGVKFDLLGEGQAVSTGWVADDDLGILALDLDNSGTIDSGRELFGQATLLPNGHRAQNGYEALTQYDSNHDGFIDANDPIYGKLMVWFDRDRDGKTAPGELRSLKEVGVTRIGLTYKPVTDERVYNAGNMVKYEARFQGPTSCPMDGCKSYDIFFGTTLSIAGK